ncbi:uncharacterized protein NDAI_0I01200 [Naumovozyma dairenensis CBS 421]|uniref:Uncharacterized protein n=1 Tax=Naumovozyma dairenensis (strain ATCC 10597 / BCRC 20456 / CBS 421 / NBRC 0211 / NRRL Y-12639) TaxID=1071378 RepID=G0WFX8_NAUDC|nr:hypothetical protein NDAI_0I01200 [Naumovozyma dairenensis CBS 421]CCD26689.1 hypothetical protein NDAI_0I01200 [Naumovozyma dairenensis CBS 421]
MSNTLEASFRSERVADSTTSPVYLSIDNIYDGQKQPILVENQPRGCSPMLILNENTYEFNNEDPTKFMPTSDIYLWNTSEARYIGKSDRGDEMYCILSSEGTLSIVHKKYDSKKNGQKGPFYFGVEKKFVFNDILNPEIPFLMTSYLRRIYYSYDKRSIRCVAATGELKDTLEAISRETHFYPIVFSLGFTEELIHFEILGRGGILACIFRDTTSNYLGVQYTRWCAEQSQFVLVTKKLMVENAESVGDLKVKKLFDYILIAFDPHYRKTWILSPKYESKCFTNDILPESVEVSERFDIIQKDKKSTIYIYTKDGRVFSFRITVNQKGVLQVMPWKPLDLGVEQLGLKFELIWTFNDGLQFFFYKDGKIHLLDTSKGNKIINIGLTSEKTPEYINYVDAQPIPNGGSDLDSLLLAGITKEGYGILEKRHCHKVVSNSASTIFNIPHAPVFDIWVDDNMLYYDTGSSIGELPHNFKLKQYGNSSRRLPNIEIEELYYGALMHFVATQDKNPNDYSIVAKERLLWESRDMRTLDEKDYGKSYYKGNTDALLKFLTNHGDFVSIRMGRDRTFSLVHSTNYSKYLNHLDEATLLTSYNSMNFFCQRNHLSRFIDNSKPIQINLPPDFFAAEMTTITYNEILWKERQRHTYIVLSSYDGKILLFSLTLEKLLEIQLDTRKPLKYTSCDDPEFALLVLYNEDVILMINLADLIYFTIEFKFKARTIVWIDSEKPKRRRPKSFLILDTKNTVHFYDFVSKKSTLNELYSAVSSLTLPLTSEIPLRLLVLPNSPQWAVLLSFQENTSETLLSILNYKTMEVIQRLVVESMYSNCLIEPLLPQEDGLSNLRFELEKYFILYYRHNSEPKFFIYRLSGHTLECVQVQKLLFPVTHILVSRLDVYFYGSQFEHYCIELLPGNVVKLKKTGQTNMLENYPTFFTGSFVNNETLVTVDPFDGTKRYEKQSLQAKSFHADTLELENYCNTYNLVTHVATKRVYRELENKKSPSFKESYLQDGLDAFRELSIKPLTIPGRLYRAMADLQNYLYIYYELGSKDESRSVLSPFYKVQLPGTITNVIPVRPHFENIQLEPESSYPLWRNRIPLFLVTCSNSQLFIISEITKKQVREKFREYTPPMPEHIYPFQRNSGCSLINYPPRNEDKLCPPGHTYQIEVLEETLPQRIAIKFLRTGLESSPSHPDSNDSDSNCSLP